MGESTTWILQECPKDIDLSRGRRECYTELNVLQLNTGICLSN